MLRWMRAAVVKLRLFVGKSQTTGGLSVPDQLTDMQPQAATASHSNKTQLPPLPLLLRLVVRLLVRLFTRVRLRQFSGGPANEVKRQLCDVLPLSTGC